MTRILLFTMVFLNGVMFANEAFAQSKKELIATMNTRVDSLTNLLSQERSANTGLANENKSLQSKLRNLEVDLQGKMKSKDALEKKSNSQEQTIEEQKQTIAGLEKSLAETEKLLASAKAQIPRIPENDFDKVRESMVKVEGDYGPTIAWIREAVADPGNKAYFTSRCNSFIKDVTERDYPGGLTEAEMKSKWGKTYDLSRINFMHKWENGNCGWENYYVNDISYMGSLNDGIWFHVPIKGGCAKGDFTQSVIRDIKVVIVNGERKIDNFISIYDGG